MREDGNGSEQRRGWQPPEYVSPWASASGTGGEAERGETLSFGMNDDEARYEPPAPTYGPGPGVYTAGPDEYSWSERGSAGGSPSSNPTEPIVPGFSDNPGGGGAQGGYGQGGYGQGGFDSPGGPEGPGGPGGPWPGYGVPEMPAYGKQRSALGRFLVYAAVAVLAAGVGAGAAVWLNSPSNNTPGPTAKSIPLPGGGNNNGGGNSGTGGNGGTINAQRVASKVDPGIVDVTSTLSYSSQTAEGTGMVLTSDGLVLTNNHVIDQATNVRVTLVESGRSYQARVIGYDSSDDVALLQVEGASGLKTVSPGNSNSITVGQQVLALGNAQGRMGMPTPAAGTVNALHKTISAGDSSNSSLTETLHDMIQTDAPIQEGDSGGPLVNAAGLVIGMDTAANTSSGQFGQGSGTTGFAIPINNALAIARQIASGQGSKTVHIGLAGFMGVSVMNISESQTCLQNDPNLSGGYTPPVSSGALVCLVQPNTPSSGAGLIAGDVITAVNGRPVNSKDGLTSLIAPSHPGQTIRVTYYDTNGSKHTVNMALTSIAR